MKYANKNWGNKIVDVKLYYKCLDKVNIRTYQKNQIWAFLRMPNMVNKISWKKRFRRADLVSIERPSQRLRPTFIFAGFLHCKDTINCLQKNPFQPNQAYYCIGFWKLLNVLLSGIAGEASWPMRIIETFPSKQMYLYLSLVERKVSEFYHNMH